AVVAAAAEIGRVDELIARGVELRHESVGGPTKGRLNGIHRRKVWRSGDSCDINIAGAVQRDAAREISGASTEERRINQSTCGIQVRDEGVEPPALRRLQFVLNREIGRARKSGHVSIARCVYRDGAGVVLIVAAEICRIDKLA